MTQRRKALQIVADGTPGGGTTIVLGLCDDLAASGEWDVHLVTAPDSYAAARARDCGHSVHELNLFGLKSVGHAQAALAKLVQALKPDVIHTHGGRAGFSVALLSLTQRLAPTVHTVHGLHFQRKPMATRLLGAASEWLIASRLSRLIYVSSGDRRLAEAWRISPTPAAKAAIIVNGIDLDRLRDPDVRQPKHDLIFIGRLVAQKNPLYLVELLRQPALRKARLLVVGGGELEAELQALARHHRIDDRIEFAGTCDHATTLAHLKRARVCILPSRWEGLPVTAIEAAAAGVPIVASNISGTDEVVIDGTTGYLVDLEKPDVFAGRIATLLSDDAAHRSMSRAAQEAARRRFSREACSRSYVTVYQQLLHGA